jgi:glycosyltransferase involved in cell wall biosynthesis
LLSRNCNFNARKKNHGKPKLLFVVTEDWYFVSHRLPLAMAALKAGFDVVVATRARKYASEIQDAGIRLIPFEMSRRVGNPLREVIALCLLYRREQPDIVHHVALKPVLYGSMAMCLRPKAAQVNAVAGLGWLFISRSRLARLVSPAIRWMLAWLLSAPRCRVIVQNPDDENLLKQAGVSESGLRMVRGSGVDTSVFLPSPEPSEPICVMMATRILWDKGVGEFVEAARKLKLTKSKARFVLVGEPDKDNPASVPQDILKAWQKENVVEWMGHCNDMVATLKMAHVVCLPSYREGLPKVLIEAAACGKPIVTTDVPGCREVVRDGDNGLLVPVRDSEALSKALLQLIENSELRAQMGKRGREIASVEFSSDRVIEKTLDIYKELLE